MGASLSLVYSDSAQLTAPVSQSHRLPLNTGSHGPTGCMAMHFTPSFLLLVKQLDGGCAFKVELYFINVRSLWVGVLVDVLGRVSK